MIKLEKLNEIYDNIYLKSVEKNKELNNKIKQIKHNTKITILKIFGIILCIVIFLVFITKNIELLVLLIFVPGPLYIYYLAHKGSEMRKANLNNDTETLYNDIRTNIIQQINTGLKYNANEGILKETYNKGLYENYDRFYSEDKIEGLLDKSKVTISYVATSNGHTPDRGYNEFKWLFRGYFITFDFVNNKNLKIKIKKDGIEELEQKLLNGEDEVFVKNIKNQIELYIEKSKLTPEVTIIHNKVYIRIRANSLDNDLLDKTNLKNYYNGINNIVQLIISVLKIN